MMPPSALPRALWLLWAGLWLCSFGSGAVQMAAVALAVERLTAPLQFGLLALLVKVPGLLVWLLAGVAADRVPRRRLAMACDLADAAGFLLCAVLLAGSAVPGWPLLVVVAVVLAINELTDALALTAIDAAIPDLVPPGRLAWAMGVDHGASALCHAAGTLAGGALCQFAGAWMAFAVATVACLASWCLWWWVRLPPVPHRDDGGGVRAWMADAKAGLGHLRREPGLAGLLAVFAILAAAGAAAGVVLPFRILKELELGTIALAVLAVAGGIGFAIGTAVSHRLCRLLGRHSWWAPVLGLALAAGWLVLPWLTQTPWLAAGALVGGMNYGAFFLALQAVPPATVDTALRGRVAGLVQAATAVGVMVGAVAGGALDLALGHAFAPYCAVLAGVGALAALPLAFAPVRAVVARAHGGARPLQNAS